LAREDIAFVEHYVVIIRDMPRLRRLARGEEAIETRRTKPISDHIRERLRWTGSADYASNRREVVDTSARGDEV
jgi:hypothetical protein